MRVPVVANGEIWTVADALRCRRESGCDALMLGRGMVSDPGLALVGQRIEPRARAGRLKQWLNYLRRAHPQADVAYAAVRAINDPLAVAQRLGLAPLDAAATATLAVPAAASRLLEFVP